jgi:hypothetical protein
MAKKNGKNSKDKAKKKPLKKAAPKKVAKPAAKKAAPAKKAAASKAPAKKPTPAKKAAAPGKAPAASASPKKGAAPAKPEKVLKGKPQPAPEKPAKAGKAPKAAPPPEAAEMEAEGAEEESDEEVVLTDAEGRRYCRVKDCDQLAAVDTYCRYHYLLFWKRIQVRKKILSEGKLERYIEELTARYPDKFLDMLRKDLRSEKEFLGAIQELEIDESAVDNEFEDEAQTYIDEVRGMGEPTERGESEDF